MIKEPIPVPVIITAIIALVIIEIAAMMMGYNGILRMIIVAGIFGLAGWTIPIPHKQTVKGGK